MENILNNLNYIFYIKEFKYRLLYSIFSIILTIICCYIYIEPIIYLLTKYLLINMNSHRFIFNQLINILYIYIKLSIFLGFFINFPFFLLNIYFYFFNSLYKYEINFLKNLYILISFLYLANIYIFFNYIIPNFINIFLNFEQYNFFFPLHFEARLDEFINLMIKIFFNIALIFQLPSIWYICIYLKVIDNLFIIKYRKFFYIFYLIFSALIAPPELWAQLIIFFLFLFLHEILIIFIIFFQNF